MHHIGARGTESAAIIVRLTPPYAFAAQYISYKWVLTSAACTVFSDFLLIAPDNEILAPLLLRLRGGAHCA